MFQGFLVGMYICYSHQVSTERESHKTISSMDTGTIHLSFDLITDLKCSVHSMIWINCFSWQTGFVFLSRRIIARVFVSSAPLRMLHWFPTWKLGQFHFNLQCSLGRWWLDCEPAPWLNNNVRISMSISWHKKDFLVCVLVLSGTRRVLNESVNIPSSFSIRLNAFVPKKVVWNLYLFILPMSTLLIHICMTKISWI